jgi:hypothetical protein
VFVDTSAAFERNYRQPLIILARLELLRVHWSPYVAGEIARVATREAALFTVRRLTAGQAAEPRVTEAIQEVRRNIDSVVALLERSWSSPLPERLRDSMVMIADVPVPDENDRPILAGASAVDAAFLLSKDKETFPHGGTFDKLAFWHPDTFLTALFEDNPDAYATVIDELRLLPSDGSLFPRS